MYQGAAGGWTLGWLCSPRSCVHVAVCQNLVPLVNIKIAGKWMFIPLKMVLIGIDPYPCHYSPHRFDFENFSEWQDPPRRARRDWKNQPGCEPPEPKKVPKKVPCPPQKKTVWMSQNVPHLPHKSIVSMSPSAIVVCLWMSCVWQSCVWRLAVGGGRRRTEVHQKNKNPTQKCGEQKPNKSQKPSEAKAKSQKPSGHANGRC